MTNDFKTFINWATSKLFLLIVILVLVILFALFFFYFDVQILKDFLSNSLATILGLIIGIPIGIWAAERQENKSQLEKAKKVFDVISIEIMDNSRVISQWLATQEAKNLNTIWMLFSYLKDEAWRALSDGGDLAQLNNPLMIKDLSESYAYVHALKLMSQRYFDVLYLSGPGRAGYFGTDNDDEMYDGILKLAKEADQYSNIFTLKISTGYYGVNWGKAISEPDPD